MNLLRRQHDAIGALLEKRVFFIGGSPKSGTTWLQRLLDAHPAVVCKGESHSADHLGRLLMDCLNRHNQALAKANAEVFGDQGGFPLYDRDDLAYLLAAALLLGLGKAAAGREVAAIGEKTPDNVRFFGVLHAIFPDAKFIHLVRDGRDCAISGWFHIRRVNPEWAAKTFPNLRGYAEMFAREWAEDLAQASAFAAARPGACVTIRYEDLVADAPARVADILAFIGIAADAVAECCAAASFARLSGGRAQGQEDRGSLYRKGQPGDWQNHFDAELAERFRQAAGPWLDRFGYA